MFEAVIRWLVGGAPAPAGEVAPVREATFGRTIDDDDGQFRSLTGNSERDLTPLDQLRMQKVAAWLWERNPLANRLVELVVAFLLGEGVRLTCQNEEGQKVLTRFWRDPINQMGLKLESMVREAELFGEQCYPVFVNKFNGAVRLGYLDPQLIETVVMDPDNPSQPIGVVTVKDKEGAARRYRVLVGAGKDQEDAELFTSRTVEIRKTFSDGDCFYLRLNHLMGGKRGRSAILAQMDWLDGYDEFMWGELDRARDLRSVLWDVTINNATQQEIDERAKKITAPAGREVRVHNDQETWEPKTAELAASESEAVSRLMRNHVLGGSTVPEHWFGGGGDVNRAVGAEMGEPTFKVLTQKQKRWKELLELMGRYVLASSKTLKGYDPDDEQWAVVAEFPELTARDTTKYAAALQQVAAAAVVMIGQGLLTEETALRVINTIGGRLGVEIDAKVELEAARKEKEKRDREAMENYGAPGGMTPGDDGTGGEGGDDNRPRVPGMARTPAQGADNSARQAAAQDAQE